MGQKGRLFMKLLKKNQVIIYVIAVMLMVVGYLNYTTRTADEVAQASSSEVNETGGEANVGDARLVSSEDVVENTTNETNTTESQIAENINTLNTTNQTTSNTITQETSTSNTDDYFAKSKLERDTMYSQMIETYENILNSSNASETQKQSATEEITKINNTKNSIMISENLLKTKGFENAVIFANDESISVIIGTSELKEDEIAQVQNIISREMKADIENIHISTK